MSTGAEIGAGAGAAAGVAVAQQAATPTPTNLIRRAIAIPPGDGVSIYTLSDTDNFRVEALSFTIDTTGAGSPDDVRLDFLTKTSSVIVGATVGLAQAAGLVVTYTIAPNLNPCDGVVYAADGLTPDTFADVTLVSGCKVRIRALDAVAGTVDTLARITGGIIWADPVAPIATPAHEPIYLPVPIVGSVASPSTLAPVTGPGVPSAQPGVGAGG